MTPPWLLHEDADLLAVAKPSGVATHQAGVGRQAGLHEWVSAARGGESLAVLHRLDKGTSGVLLFGRSQRANQALSAQLGERRAHKRYLFLTPSHPRRPAKLFCDERVRKKPRRPGSEVDAETEFEVHTRGGDWDLIEARPLTGRTHQIRVHAARLGMPIAGDTDYGGVSAARLFLHAAAIRIQHPDGSGPLTVESPLPRSFEQVLDGLAPHDPRVAAQACREAREALLDPAETDGYLWLDRHHDGLRERRVERLGPVAHVLVYDSGAALPRPWVDALLAQPGVEAVVARRRSGKGDPNRDAPTHELLAGALAAPRFEVRELGLRYWVDLDASPTSTGLFLDQRDTRARLLAQDLTGKRALNAFAHTGSLSVAAARAGAWTQTLDLSKGYLDWARENMRLNEIDPAEHDFVFGDALDWLGRFQRQGRRYDLVLLDPPSFSRSGKSRRGGGGHRSGGGRRSGGGKKTRTWSVERDLDQLVALGAALLEPQGQLYVSTNLQRMPAERFAATVRAGLQAAGRQGAVELVSLPLDHRSGPGDPPYLKGAWVALVD